MYFLHYQEIRRIIAVPHGMLVTSGGMFVWLLSRG